MPMAHDIGNTGLFVQVIPYPLPGLFPMVERGHTQEIEGDYRSGESLVIRLPWQRAIVLGRWSRRINEEGEALARALRAREVDIADLNFPEPYDEAA